MPNFRINLASSTLNTLKEMLSKAEHRGDLRTVKRINAILTVGEGYSCSVIASILHACDESTRHWFAAFLQKGCESVRPGKFPGRRPQID